MAMKLFDRLPHELKLIRGINEYLKNELKPYISRNVYPGLNGFPILFLKSSLI